MKTRTPRSTYRKLACDVCSLAFRLFSQLTQQTKTKHKNKSDLQKICEHYHQTRVNQTIKFKKCYPSKEQNLDQTYDSLQQGEWVDFEVILQG